ncbi:MAG: ATP-binding protein [Spirulinaceae cyanobacterium]
MKRILVLSINQDNSKFLTDLLAESYQLIWPQPETGFIPQAKQLLTQPFDLCIGDFSTLELLKQEILNRRETEKPVFLPFALITSHQEIDITTDSLEYLVNDIIYAPLEKALLQTRLRVLLRSRQMSLQLKIANEKLEREAQERIKVEKALQQSEIRFRQLAENISEVFWISTPDKSKILYLSSAYERMWGQSCQSVYDNSQAWLNIIHPEDRQRVKASLEVEKRGEFSKQEYRIIHPDKGIRWMWGRAFPVFEAGEFTCLVGVVEDITERKQAELEMSKALVAEKELNQLKSSFVSMVSHEFRNPLNSISGLVQILKLYGNELTTEKKQAMFPRIQSSIERMTNLLDDMLMIGKAEEGKLKFKLAFLELEKFCHSLISEIKLSQDKKHEIILNYQGKTASIIDEKLLRYILTNLLSNAVKYSPQGKTINFDVICDSSQVVFQIKDRGIGIPVEDQKRLFESFYRAENVNQIEGTGLGLAIVKHCVDLHGGTITFKSEEGIGTKFTLTIPNALKEEAKF